MAGVSSGSDWWPLPPYRQAAITSAVTTAMPRRVTQTSFDSSRRLRPCVLRTVEVLRTRRSSTSSPDP